MSIADQLFHLFLLAIPIASIARTVANEEVFREPREWCAERSKRCQRWYKRKFFYLFTCEYCFSHYVTLAVLCVTRLHLLYEDWRGLVVAFFSLVFMANFYLNIYARLRVEISREKAVTKKIEECPPGQMPAIADPKVRPPQ